MNINNAYEILRLSPPITRENLITVYRKLALEHHPDKGGDPAKFRMVTEAKNYLLKNLTIVVDTFKNDLLDKFYAALRNKPIEQKIAPQYPKQTDLAILVIKYLSKIDSLNVSITVDEILIMRNNRNGIWIISIDQFDNIIVQVEKINVNIIKFYKSTEIKTAINEFIKLL